MNTTGVKLPSKGKQPPTKEETRLTISPKIFKSLLASHVQNRHRVHKLGEVFESYDWTAGDDILYLNYLIASILGMEPDEPNQTEEQFDFIEEQVIHFYDVYIIRKSKKPTSYELNYLQGFKKKDIDNLYNKLLKAQRKFGKMVDGDDIHENNQPVNETERKPYTINETIIKKLIARHVQNHQRYNELYDVFGQEGTDNDVVFINWIIAEMFGVVDAEYKSKAYYLFNKFIDTVSSDDIKPSDETNDYWGYPEKDIDAIYDKLLEIQKEYFEAKQEGGQS